MQKLALALAIFSCGCKPLFLYLYSVGIPEVIPYPNRILCIPALLIGLGSWCRVRTFARSWPVLACLSIMLAGIFWVDPTERGRAILVFAGIATSLPIAALIVETRAYRFCVHVFLVTAISNLFFLIYLQGLFPEGSRLGHLALEGVLISDPNGLATLLGVAAVLTISLMQIKNGQGNREQGSTVAINGIVLAFLTFGILLTASRSGMLSLFAVVGLFAFSCNTKATHRIAILTTGGLALLAISCTENRISTRFKDSEGLVGIGHRLPIWETGMWVLNSDQDHFVFGVGTGGIDKALAENSLHQDTFRRGRDNISRRASHNIYLDWLVSHGLLGLPLGLWIFFSGFRRARGLDRYDRSFSRCSLLAYCAIVSMATEFYRLPLTTGVCALLLAMLSGQFLAPWPVKKSLGINQSKRHRRAPARVPRHLEIA